METTAALPLNESLRDMKDDAVTISSFWQQPGVG